MSSATRREPAAFVNFAPVERHAPGVAPAPPPTRAPAAAPPAPPAAARRRWRRPPRLTRPSTPLGRCGPRPTRTRAGESLCGASDDPHARRRRSAPTQSRAPPPSAADGSPRPQRRPRRRPRPRRASLAGAGSRARARRWRHDDAAPDPAPAPARRAAGIIGAATASSAPSSVRAQCRASSCSCPAGPLPCSVRASPRADPFISLATRLRRRAAAAKLSCRRRLVGRGRAVGGDVRAPARAARRRRRGRAARAPCTRRRPSPRTPVEVDLALADAAIEPTVLPAPSARPERRQPCPATSQTPTTGRR